MDILAYQKASKAKAALKKAKNRIGMEGSESGVKDIKGIHANLKVRLEQLELKDPKITLNSRVSEMEKNIAVNLNKHNLRVNSIANHQKYGLKELLFDDLADTSGIDTTLSAGVLHDPTARKFGLAVGQTQANVVTQPEPVAANMLSISFASNANAMSKVSVPFTGGVYTNTEVVNGKLQLKKKDATTYFKTGSYESSVIDLGDNFKTLYKLEHTLTKPAGTSISLSVASSADGVSFSQYVPLNQDGTIPQSHGQYVKVKAELTAGYVTQEKLVHDFTTEEASQFEENDLLVMDGSVKMKTAHSLPMAADTSFTEAGSLLKVTLDNNRFKVIEKVEVK